MYLQTICRRSKHEFDCDLPPPAAIEAQQAIGWAEHLVIVYPLWLGSMPALLKEVFPPGFAFQVGGRAWQKRLSGRSARIVTSMGMPAVIYCWCFGAHGLKGLEQSVLRFCGIRPVRESLIGMVEGSEKIRRRWLERMRRLGARAG